MSVAVDPRRRLELRLPRVRVGAIPAWAVATAGLSALLGISVALRTTGIHGAFWIDEGLSVGIAGHGFLDIPHVLRLDGSPPLYYMILHVWMVLFGQGQATTHALSLLFALLTIPAAFWGAGSLFGRRAAWMGAGLAAVNPFLTYYAQETRMYALVTLLSLLVAASFTHVFVLRNRRYLPAFSLSLTALIYSHNWGLFLAVGSVVALLPAWFAVRDRRALIKDIVLGYGIVGVLYAPWLPTLLFQAKYTGAPWAEIPSLSDVFGPITGILGGPTVPLALLLAGGSGLATIAKEPRRTEPTAPVRDVRVVAMWTLVILPLAALAVAWGVSQISPAFTGRYFAAFVGPILLLSAVGLAHAGRLGLVAIAIIAVLWFDPRTAAIDHKSDVRIVAARIKSDLYPGDLVVSVQPEQTSVLHYYLPPGLRYADSIGMIGDPGVFDWRNALDKLRAAQPQRVLDSYVSSLRPGQTLVLVNPIIRTADWSAPWTAEIRRRSGQWQRDADANVNLVRIGAQPRFRNGPLARGVRVTLYRRTAVPRDLKAEARARRELAAAQAAQG